MNISFKKLLIGLGVAIISFEIFLGMLLGYLVGKFFAGKEAGIAGRGKSLIFSVGKYKIHFHHWIYALGIFLIFITFHFFPISPSFSVGFFGGVISQGLTYPDWSSIIVKKSHDS